MTTIEKPTTNVPTPANLADITPSLNQGDMVAVQEVHQDGAVKSVLGEVATREEYRSNNASALDPAQFDRMAEANKVTLDSNVDDEKVQDELAGGFTIHDATQAEVQVDEDHDELPEDLKDQLGEPDNDEVVASDDEAHVA